MHLANEPHTNNLKTAQDSIAHARKIAAQRRQFFPRPKILTDFPKLEAKVTYTVQAVPSFSGEPAETEQPISKRIISVRQIQKAVCIYSRISIDDMISPRRSAALIVPRHIAMMLCRIMSRRSYPEIGRKFSRDHTTVLSALVKLEPVMIEVLKEIKLGKSSLPEIVQFAFDEFVRIKPKTRYHRRLSNLAA